MLTEEASVSQDIEEQIQQYTELVGYVPAGIRARLELLSEWAPEFLETIERTRREGVAPKTLDPIMVQLLMFAILCFDRDEEALAHARIALRQGASVEQLLDVIRVTGWLGGAQAYNMGFRSLQRALRDEGRAAPSVEG